MPDDTNEQRISPTIARQELLAYFRILNRQCFNKQLSDPYIHMLHGAPEGINTPMLYWTNKGRPTISIAKEKLMGSSYEEMFPELCYTVVTYWLAAEAKIQGTPIDGNDNKLSYDGSSHEEFQKKLEYVNRNAKPTFFNVNVSDYSLG